MMVKYLTEYLFLMLTIILISACHMNEVNIDEHSTRDEYAFIVSGLREKGIRKSYNGYDTLLHYAASKDNVILVEEIIKYTLDPDLETGEGYTPLMDAVNSRAFSSVKYLLQYGANPNAITRKGVTPLHYAASVNSLEIVKELIKYGAKTDIGTGNSYQTPLHLAAFVGADAGLINILAKGVKYIDRPVYGGNTPLQNAIALNHASAAAALYDLGANPFIENVYGESAYSILKDQIEGISVDDKNVNCEIDPGIIELYLEWGRRLVEGTPR